LGQIESAVKFVTIEIVARPKARDSTNDSLLKFLAVYTSAKKVGVLMKDTASGKLVSEWQAALEGAASKPEVTDMTPAISSLLAVKDEDELVSTFPLQLFFNT
jgi:nucleosome binding factor SPN SPT16 subunit